jgi:hypothetical protein
MYISISLVVGIAIIPRELGKVNTQTDHNLVLFKDGHWRKVDYAKQYSLGLPPPPFDDKHTRVDTTIVVLISALRETRLAATVFSLLQKASNPSRIHFSITQQNSPDDTDILVEYCELWGFPTKFDKVTWKPLPGKENEACPYLSNIRVIRMLASEAQGPVYARALGNTLLNYETDDFCMQIDAHTLAWQDWDKLMLEDWGKAENEFAILTTYPTNYKDLGINGQGVCLFFYPKSRLTFLYLSIGICHTCVVLAG